MTVDANIEVAHLPNVLSVPTTSLLQKDNQNYVLVVNRNVARKNDVRVLARGVRWVGVSGVAKNTRVIVNGADVEPGQRVRIVRGY